MLISKLMEIKVARHLDKIQDIKGDKKKKIGWGSQIRSYIFMPYTLVNHRTNYEMGNINAVMDGDIGTVYQCIFKSEKSW